MDREDHTLDRDSVLRTIDQAKSHDDFRGAQDLAEKYLQQNPRDDEVKEALQRLQDREQWSMILKFYAPCFLVLYLVIGYLSSRWGISAVAALVAAAPAMVVLIFAANGVKALLRNADSSET